MSRLSMVYNGKRADMMTKDELIDAIMNQYGFDALTVTPTQYQRLKQAAEEVFRCGFIKGEEYEQSMKTVDRYDKLAADLQAAKEAASGLDLSDDGGTCNFDSLLLILPRMKEEKILAAIEKAGCRGFKTKHYGTICYLVSPPVAAQGNARTIQAEKMMQIMKDCGWNDASVWYQMD